VAALTKLLRSLVLRRFVLNIMENGKKVKMQEVCGLLYATVRQRKIHVKNPVTVIRNGKNVDLLTLDMDEEWKEMDNILCVFTMRYRAGEETLEEARQVQHVYGQTVQVPWECLTQEGLLSVSCTGYVGGEKVMTTMLPDSFWTVAPNGAMGADESVEPTATLYEQIVAAAGRANTAAAAAEQIEARLSEDRENGVFNGVSPTVEVDGTVTAAAGSAAMVENLGTQQAVKLRFTIPRGAQGKSGRGIRDITLENGSWVVTYDDGARQMVGVPEVGGMTYPYVTDVACEDGVLAVTCQKSAAEREVVNIPIPVVTEADRQRWDGKVDMAVENMLSYPEYGSMWLFYTNGTQEVKYLLPDPTEAAEGAFLRVNADGEMAWANLTDVSKEGA